MSKREVIQPHEGDKRYVRRDEKGELTNDQVNVGKSLAADRRSKAKTVVPKGQADRGDQKKSGCPRESDNTPVFQAACPIR
jgi:hypothetical protein